MCNKKLLFTDMALLKSIQQLYEETYLNSASSEKLYIPIVCDDIACHMNTDAEMVFQRLYNHLEHKYGYTEDGNIKRHFFAMKVGSKNHCINYPYMCAVLADMKDNAFKLILTNIVAWSSLIISLFTFLQSFSN